MISTTCYYSLLLCKSAAFVSISDLYRYASSATQSQPDALGIQSMYLILPRTSYDKVTTKRELSDWTSTIRDLLLPLYELQIFIVKMRIVIVILHMIPNTLNVWLNTYLNPCRTGTAIRRDVNVREVIQKFDSRSLFASCRYMCSQSCRIRHGAYYFHLHAVTI